MKDILWEIIKPLFYFIVNKVYSSIRGDENNK